MAAGVAAARLCAHGERRARLLAAGPELGRVALRGAAVTAPSSWFSSAHDFDVRPAEGQLLQLRAADSDDRDTWVRHLEQAQVTDLPFDICDLCSSVT